MNIPRIEQLEPKFCNQKSFSGKALVIYADDSIVLTSYGVSIVEFNDRTDTFTFNKLNADYISMTTCKHLKEFLRQLEDEQKIPHLVEKLIKCANKSSFKQAVMYYCEKGMSVEYDRYIGELLVVHS